MFYEVTPAAGEQAQLMDKLKTNGCDVIQTSRGLVVRAPERLEDFKKTYGLASATEIDSRTPDLSPDVLKFIGG